MHKRQIGAFIACGAILFSALVGGTFWAGQTGTVKAGGSTGVSAAQAPAQAAKAAAVVTVEIKSFKFVPADLTVAPGTKVRFINRDSVVHNVVQAVPSAPTKAGAFASKELKQGGTFEVVLTKEGEYPYLCNTGGHYAVGMIGKIKVSKAAKPADGQTVGSKDQPAGDHAAEHSNAAEAGKAGSATTGSQIPAEIAKLPFRTVGKDGVVEFNLYTKEIRHELTKGVTVTAWAFNGTVPGPEMRVQPGQKVRITYYNTHSQPHSIHFHGIETEQAHDGVPATSHGVMPGEKFTYEWTAPEEPGTYIYHCHVDSYRHVDQGMYGALIVEPKAGSSVAWSQEYTMILDDWDTHVKVDGAKYEPKWNYFTLNGKSFPDTEPLHFKQGTTTLVRLINMGYRPYTMHLHGNHFTVVATDGFDLPAPYKKDTLLIGPGERYNILVKGDKQGIFPFHAHDLNTVANDSVYPGGLLAITDYPAK